MVMWMSPLRAKSCPCPVAPGPFKSMPTPLKISFGLPVGFTPACLSQSISFLFVATSLYISIGSLTYLQCFYNCQSTETQFKLLCFSTVATIIYMFIFIYLCVYFCYTAISLFFPINVVPTVGKPIVYFACTS